MACRGQQSRRRAEDEAERSPAHHRYSELTGRPRREVRFMGLITCGPLAGGQDGGILVARRMT